jgi:putative membrane protein
MQTLQSDPIEVRVLGSVLDAQWMPEGWHMQGMHEWMSGWGAWGMLIPLIFWIVVLVGLAVLIQKLILEQRRGPPENRALDVLSERYAKGEIEREEYLRRRQDIIGA